MFSYKVGNNILVLLLPFYMDIYNLHC